MWPGKGWFPVEHSQRVAKFFNFVFRGGFFALDLIEGLKNFINVVEGLLQLVADLKDLIDGLMDAGGWPVVGAGFNRFGWTAAGAGIATSTWAATAPPKGRATGALALAVLRGS